MARGPVVLRYLPPPVPHVGSPQWRSGYLPRELSTVSSRGQGARAWLPCGKRARRASGSGHGPPSPDAEGGRPTVLPHGLPPSTCPRRARSSEGARRSWASHRQLIHDAHHGSAVTSGTRAVGYDDGQILQNANRCAPAPKMLCCNRRLRTPRAAVRWRRSVRRDRASDRAICVYGSAVKRAAWNDRSAAHGLALGAYAQEQPTMN
jgi:hypothetical protein